MPAHRERQRAVAGRQGAGIDGGTLPCFGQNRQHHQVVGGLGDQAVQQGLDPCEAVPAEGEAAPHGGGEVVSGGRSIRPRGRRTGLGQQAAGVAGRGRSLGLQDGGHLFQGERVEAVTRGLDQRTSQLCQSREPTGPQPARGQGPECACRHRGRNHGVPGLADQHLPGPVGLVGQACPVEHDRGPGRGRRIGTARREDRRRDAAPPCPDGCVVGNVHRSSPLHDRPPPGRDPFRGDGLVGEPLRGPSIRRRTALERDGDPQRRPGRQRDHRRGRGQPRTASGLAIPRSGLGPDGRPQVAVLDSRRPAGGAPQIHGNAAVGQQARPMHRSPIDRAGDGHGQAHRHRRVVGELQHDHPVRPSPSRRGSQHHVAPGHLHGRGGDRHVVDQARAHGRLLCGDVPAILSADGPAHPPAGTGRSHGPRPVGLGHRPVEITEQFSVPVTLRHRWRGLGLDPHTTGPKRPHRRVSLVGGRSSSAR